MEHVKWWDHIRNLSAILGIANIVLVGFVGYYAKSLWNASMAGPGVSLSCPPDTHSHEVTISGSRSRNNDQVETFVGPQDGSCAYYSQGLAESVTADRGSWATTARLGNPFGLGHRKPPPLDYDIVAVLKNPIYHSVDLSLFPKCGALFPEWIAKQPGIDAVASCRINRKPELAVICSDMPVITSPTQSCCSYNANGDTCDRTCNPSILRPVRSPVALGWSKGEEAMYVELFESPLGKSPNGFPRVAVRSGDRVDLAPATYEMKIRRHEGDQCISSSWFQVVGGQ